MNLICGIVAVDGKYNLMLYTILSKQMNLIFQKPVVKSKDELYIDILVTGSVARRKGIGTALLNHAFEIPEYTVWSVEAFSNNQAAIRLYEKNGFKVVQSKKTLFHASFRSRISYKTEKEEERSRGRISIKEGIIPHL